MTMFDVLDRLSSATSSKVVEAWQRWQDGDLTEPEFRTLARAILVRSGARSTALADLSLSAAVAQLSRDVRATDGLEPIYGETEAENAVSESLATTSYQRDPLKAVTSIGGAFVMAAYQDSYSKGMQSYGITFWRRAPNEGACELCIDLTGGIMTSDVPMYHHLGCGCIQESLQAE